MNGRPRFILVVEDDLLIRSSIVEVLVTEGHRAFGAANGKLALDFLQSMPDVPDLILLDLMMPVMDGWQLRTELQKDPRLSAIPVVVVTADGNARQKAKIISAEGWVKKPIEIVELLLAVERYSGV